MDVALVAETGQLLCVALPFCLPPRLIDCLRLATKVISQISDPCGGAKREHIQWFAVSMYGMWIYDYFLTLGDEVRHSYRSLRQQCQDLTDAQIQFAWSGRKSWSESTLISPKYPIADTITQ